METGRSKPESHVAQQSRRDKLRVVHHLEEFTSNPGQSVFCSGLNSDLVRLHSARSLNVGSDRSMFPSEVIDFSATSNLQLIHRDAMVRQLVGASPSNPLVFYGDQQNFDSLRRFNAQQYTNWVINNPSELGHHNITQNPMFAREVLSDDVKANPIGSASMHYLVKTDTNSRYQDVHSAVTNPTSEISSQDSQKHCGDADFPSKCYQHPLLEVVSPAVLANELSSGNELALLPAYGGEVSAARCNAIAAWNDSSAEVSCHRGNSDTNAQGLSLSLSSNPSSTMDMGRHNQSVGVPNSGYSNAVSKPSVSGKESGKALQDVTGIATLSAQWSTGPLGPFTGYATILKSSKFLKPAQELLDELCGVLGPKPVEMHIMLQRISEESCMGSGGSSSANSFHPEDQQKKATLVYMQDEVCRRYKQYHQQMQMVVSSFESVAGLNAATPFISLALKTVTRNFRCLKNAISDQLRNVKKSLGENFPTQHSGTSGSKTDKTVPVNQSFHGSRSFGANVGFFENHHHVWRPQRGLPEQAVAILRAWLFEHFLHPYPTDTDKHMLATQTGLSRNQVSNWFINARVRLWKPMVEEIHALETKGLPEPDQISNPNERQSTHDGTNQREMDQPLQRPRQPNMADAADEQQMECSGIGSSVGPRDSLTVGQWNQEIQSRLEYHHQVSTSIEGSLIGLMRYPQRSVELSGLGAVSLSLGLRHNVGGSQQQQQHDVGFRQHFAGDTICDFVD